MGVMEWEAQKTSRVITSKSNHFLYTWIWVCGIVERRVAIMAEFIIDTDYP